MNSIKSIPKFKASILSLICILFVHIITLYVFSEKQKAITIIEDLELLADVNQFDSLAFLTNLNTESDILRKSLHRRFLDTIQYFVVSDSEAWSKYRTDSNYLALCIIETEDNFTSFKSDTQVGTLFYGESWTDYYIWILFKWFKVNHENTGVS
jgi:hypothetical protein